MKHIFNYVFVSLLFCSALQSIAQSNMYPSYNINPVAPDTSGMSDNAKQIAVKMGLGWNIGNTMEATGGETKWGNPMVTKELIDLVKKNGFNSVRIPCAWNQYLSNKSKAEIDKAWLRRVKEVVDYCVDNDMYVLLNIHWDGGWLEEHCKPESKDTNNAKQQAFWEQIATYFRDYDQHLVFASANEPNVYDAVQMAVLNSYHQTFINTVRATGGRNAYRVLVVQGPGTDFERTYNLMNELPVDNIKDRMMVEVHYYSPFNFCGLDKDASWGRMSYYWGKDNKSTTDTLHNAYWGDEEFAIRMFGNMKSKFVDKGIPILMGEYGVLRRGNLSGEDLALHLKSREYWLRYITKLALDSGCIPFFWDAGGTGTTAWGLFNRASNKVSDYQGLNAILQAAQ